MTVKEIAGRKFYLPERYQDRRKVEREMLAWERKVRYGDKAIPLNPIPKAVSQRKEELLVPIQIDTRTTAYVRLSKVRKDKWLKVFGSMERLEKYVCSYLELNNIDIKLFKE